MLANCASAFASKQRCCYRVNVAITCTFVLILCHSLYRLSLCYCVCVDVGVLFPGFSRDKMAAN